MISFEGNNFILYSSLTLYLGICQLLTERLSDLQVKILSGTGMNKQKKMFILKE